NANDMIIGLEGHGSSTLETAGGPFALVGASHTANVETATAQFETVASTQSITESFGTSLGGGTGWVMIADAIEAAP
ncbi:MAG: hypothetical protein OK455_11380, partial [Thaumarchaeota archaeon]|nr:hypothetical protein [Nitrososphaerota archaeon]